jgi:hypothetical protein
VISDEGQAILTDIGVYQFLCRLLDPATIPLPSTYMYKDSEELSREEYAPPTTAMEVFSWASTAYEVGFFSERCSNLLH